MLLLLIPAIYIFAILITAHFSIAAAVALLAVGVIAAPIIQAWLS